MAPNQRRDMIVAYLDRQNVCTYDELAAMLKVSSMTVRRDVDRLAARGIIIKTLGGVQRANAPAEFYESGLQQRLSLNSLEKRAIAEQAIKYIHPAETIFLDGSTTSLELAKLLAKSSIQQSTVITNSFLTSYELGRSKDITILTVGGRYDPETSCCVGASSEDQAKKYFVDKAFVSTKGFLPAEGTFESSIGLFRIKQLIAAQSTEVVLLADHSKFGQRALCKVLDISQIHTVITDSRVPSMAVSLLEKAGKNILIAETESSEPEVSVNAT